MIEMEWVEEFAKREPLGTRFFGSTNRHFSIVGQALVVSHDEVAVDFLD